MKKKSEDQWTVVVIAPREGSSKPEDHAECDAYDKDDPKHPTYTERALDNADYERKRRLEEGE